MAGKPRYFRAFGTCWNVEDVLPEGTRDSDLVALAKQIEDVHRQRTLALTTQVSRDLFAERLNLPCGEDWITACGISLAADPKPGYDVNADASLWTEVQFDPREFLTLPSDPEVIGERLIAATEEGLTKLEEFQSFPSEVIRASCETFRTNNYVAHYGTKKGKIEGTPLQTRLDVFVDPLVTRRDLCVLYRGKPLLSTTVTHIDQVDWTLALALNSVELSGHTLTYRPISQEQLDWWHKVTPKAGNHPLHQPVEIDLGGFPDALALMVEKDWTTA